MKPATAISVIIIIFIVGLAIVFWQLGMFSGKEPEPAIDPFASSTITATDIFAITPTYGVSTTATGSPYDYSMTDTGFTTPPSFQQSTAADTYTVKSGDTLWIIAQHLYNDGSKWKIINDANKDKIPNPNKLKVGTVLTIPPAGESTSKKSSSKQTSGFGEQTTTQEPIRGDGTYHKVKKGDNLYNLAKKYKTTVSAIVDANPDKLTTSDTSLKPGWKLFIPKGVKKSTKTKTTTPPPFDNYGTNPQPTTPSSPVGTGGTTPAAPKTTEGVPSGAGY